MASTDPDYLTTKELAALLRVKERKVYELAAAGAVPCRKLTGKLLFPRTEIEEWLAGGAPRSAPALAPRPNVVVGSHDPLLEWALRESGSGLAAFLDGSLDGLQRLRRGEAIAGGLHLVESDDGVQFNRAHVTEALAGEPIVLLEWAWREQGLILPAGNPQAVRNLGDLNGRRVMPRQPEAGTYVLLRRLMEQHRMQDSDLELIRPPARSQTDVALAVAAGKADAGLGLACVARQFKLDYAPLLRERFDLVVYRRAYFEPPFQRLMRFCAGDLFRSHAQELGGYDLSGFGQVHYNGP